MKKIYIVNEKNKEKNIYETKQIVVFSENELPKVTLNNILRYFSDNAHFETKLNTQSFQPVYDKILEKGFFIDPEVKETFINVLKENYPGFEAEAAMMQAIKYYAYIQSCGSGVSTLPRNCNSIKEVISFLDRRMEENLRISNLRKTLSVMLLTLA